MTHHHHHRPQRRRRHRRRPFSFSLPLITLTINPHENEKRVTRCCRRHRRHYHSSTTILIHTLTSTRLSTPRVPLCQRHVLCNSTNNYSSSSSTQVPPFDIVAPCQSPFFYEQYLTSFKSEQSEHLPYLFDNIIYPQPCSPPSPTTDSTTYYQLDQANTATIINKFPTRSQLAALQPITYQQLSLVEPPSSNIQQKLPIVKRFYYDSNMSNTTTTTLLTTTPVVAHTNGNEQPTLPYARLDSSAFGTYDICQEKTLIGRKNNRRDVDVNMGTATCSPPSLIAFVFLQVPPPSSLAFTSKSSCSTAANSN